MRILVLLAGIMDTNWRLEEGRMQAVADGDEAGLEPRRLSPFDEAALETALQLRDAVPAAHVTVAVLGAKGSDKVVRTAAAFRPARALRVDTPSALCWDPTVAATAVDAVLAAAGGADIVLLGREFGDCDNGAVPSYVAERCGWPFFGRAHRVQVEEGCVRLFRSCVGDEEQAVLRPPLMVSVVNDRGNRLRHPLMKNVILARREGVDVLAVALPAERKTLALAGPTPLVPRSQACRMLEGSVDSQAAELAALLRAARAPR